MGKQKKLKISTEAETITSLLVKNTLMQTRSSYQQRLHMMQTLLNKIDRINRLFVGHILIHFSLFLAIFAPFFKNVTKCVIVFYWQMCTFVYLYISPFVHCLFFKRTKKCDVWMGNCPTRSEKKRERGKKRKIIKKMIVLKTQFLQDWGGLLIVETDKTHLFNDAKARFYF